MESNHKLSWVRIAALYLVIELLAFVALLLLDGIGGRRYEAASLDTLPSGVRTELERLFAKRPGDRPRYLRHDATLGWTISNSAKSGHYSSNALGLRCDHEVEQLPQPGRLRVASFGDSFTHGDDVEVNGTWQVQLEELLPRSEVLNFGVPAYGVDQAFLRYLARGREFQPDVVLIGFMSENIRRSLNVWRPFYRASYKFPFTKPRFVLNGDGLELVANPLPKLEDYRSLLDDPGLMLPRIAEHDSLYATRHHSSSLDVLPTVRMGKLIRGGWARRNTEVFASDGTYLVAHEGFELVARTLESFYRSVEEHGARPLIVIFPNDILLEDSDGVLPYGALVKRLDARGLDVLDLQAAFERWMPDRSAAEYYVGDHGHYSPESNGVVARALAKRLESLPPLEELRSR